MLYEVITIFTQMLALCPLMAVTTTATNGLGMGLVTTAVVTCSNLLVSLIRRHVPNQIRIPIFTLLIASLVTLVDQQDVLPGLGRGVAATVEPKARERALTLLEFVRHPGLAAGLPRLAITGIHEVDRQLARVLDPTQRALDQLDRSYNFV